MGVARINAEDLDGSLSVEGLEEHVKFMVDVSRRSSYLGGLLNRTVIQAIAVSLFIHDLTRKHGASESRMLIL